MCVLSLDHYRPILSLSTLHRGERGEEKKVFFILIILQTTLIARPELKRTVYCIICWLEGEKEEEKKVKVLD